MHSLCSSNFFLRRWCTFTPFYSKSAKYSVHLKKSGFNMSTLRNRFQHLLLLKFHHALNNFIKLRLLPWCSSTPFYPERARSSVHLSDSSKGDILKRSNIFHRWDQRGGFNLSTLRNTFQNSLLLKFHHALNFFSNLFLLFWCTSTPFYSKRARYSVHLKKSGFNLSTLRNTFQHSLLLKFYHALIIFINFPFAAPVQLYSVLLSTRARFSVHLSESSEGDILRRSKLFID